MATDGSQPAHKTWRYEQIADNIARMIERGTFQPGDRIPSVRQLSRQLKVSISTALQAVRLLEDRTLVEARPQSGYYVSAHLPAHLPEPDVSSPDPDPTQLSVHELVMRVLRDTLDPNLVQFGTAIPDPDLLPSKRLNRMLASVARRAAGLDNLYDMPPGCEALRVQIARRAVLFGCNLTPDDIVTTLGSSEAMNLCLRAVCKPGDTVAVESPTYFGILHLLESLRLRVLEIPTHPRHGISLEALKFAVEHTSVQACMVMTNVNNPLGCCISDDNKRELVELLAGHEIPLIEANEMGELYFSETDPSVAKAYDRKGLVLWCGSFSPHLSPGYRVGWVSPGRYKRDLEWLKFTTTLATPTLPQLAIAQFLASGGYEHHLRRIRREYARRVAQMSQAVTRFFPAGTKITRPSGGFVLWVQMPENVDSLELYGRALKHGITLTPGYIFSATHQYRNFIRLNVAYWSDKTEHAMQRLGQMIGELAEQPVSRP